MSNRWTYKINKKWSRSVVFMWSVNCTCMGHLIKNILHLRRHWCWQFAKDFSLRPLSMPPTHLYYKKFKQIYEFHVSVYFHFEFSCTPKNSNRSVSSMWVCIFTLNSVDLLALNNKFLCILCSHLRIAGRSSIFLRVKVAWCELAELTFLLHLLGKD